MTNTGILHISVQSPRNQADAIGIPAIPAIPLILLDAMAALGWTVEMALVAYRAATGSQPAPAESRDMSQESRDSPQMSRDIVDRDERKRLRDRTNIANKRAAERAAKESQESRDMSQESRDKNDNVAPLSPIKKDPKKEGHVAPAGAHPLPDDWQPSAGRRLTAVKAGGEIGAANLIAKFCNHFHARAHEMRTAAGWQGRFSNWIITEWPDGKEPQLSMRRLHAVASTSPSSDDKWEVLRQTVHGHAARRESG